MFSLLFFRFALLTDYVPMLPLTFYLVHDEFHHPDVGESNEGAAGAIHLTHDDPTEHELS